MNAKEDEVFEEWRKAYSHDQRKVWFVLASEILTGCLGNGVPSKFQMERIGQRIEALINAAEGK